MYAVKTMETLAAEQLVLRVLVPRLEREDE